MTAVKALWVRSVPDEVHRPTNAHFYCWLKCHCYEDVLMSIRETGQRLSQELLTRSNLGIDTGVRMMFGILARRAKRLTAAV